jgi:hypothetical protein
LTSLYKSSLHDLSVDIFKIGDFLKRIVLGVVLEQLIEGIANEECVLELGEFPEFIEFFPTLDPVVYVVRWLLPMKRVVSFMHMDSP